MAGSGAPHPASNPLTRSLRGLERLMGANREDRSLWVWMGPAATVVLTFAALLVFGSANRADLSLTIPMAIVIAVFMGALSAFYMSASSADESDSNDDDPPPDHRRPPRPGPPGIAAQPRATPTVTLPPIITAVRQPEPERDTVGAPRS